MKSSGFASLVLAALFGTLFACARDSAPLSRVGWPVPPWGDSLPPALAALHEPALNGVDKRRRSRATIRFAWSRTFHAPVMLRLERDGDTARLVTTVWSGAGGYGWGSVARRDSSVLSVAAFERLARSLHTPRFWAADSSDVAGADGATWLIEYRVGDVYRVRKAWSPEVAGRGADLRAVGVELLRAAGLDREEIY